MKLNHEGRAAPVAKVAEYARVALSISVNDPAGTVKLNAVSSAEALSARRFATIGASFTGVIVKVKISEALSEPSDAVTITSTAPLKFNGGVPLKVCVLASKVIQLGNAAPLDRVAL